MDKPFIVKSPTKPGPGYVEATPKLIRQFIESKQRIVEIRKKLEKFKEEMIAEDLKNSEERNEGI